MTNLLARRAALTALVTCAVMLHGCGTGGGTANPRYPRRAAGCELAIFHTSVPGVAAWDDLGVAEAACNIGLPVAECLRMLRSEACRMGGDILYNVPHKPFRPRDQVMLFRGQVAHTRTPGAKPAEGDDSDHDGAKPKDDASPPGSSDDAAGPVVPLPSAHPPGAAETPAESPAPAQKAPAP